METMINTCRWCERPISSRDPRRVTCGHPICARRQARARDSMRDHTTAGRYGAGLSRRALRAISEQPDTQGGQRIVTALEQCKRIGMDWQAAVLSTAHTTGETVAVVMASYKARGGTPWSR